MALFGAVARAPLAVMFMVGEMTGGYSLLVPAMITVGLAYILVGHNTIYESQVPTPADSPAHRFDFLLPLLERTRAKEVMITRLPHVTPDTPAADVREMIFNDQIKGVTVVSEEDSLRPVGVITKQDLLHLTPERQSSTNAREIMSSPPIMIDGEDTLDHALTLMSDHEIAYLPVTEGENLAGALSYRRIMRSFLSMARQAGNQLEQPTRSETGQ
jgi:CIC family chloride channel protein